MTNEFMRGPDITWHVDDIRKTVKEIGLEATINRIASMGDLKKGYIRKMVTLFANQKLNDENHNYAGSSRFWKVNRR